MAHNIPFQFQWLRVFQHPDLVLDWNLADWERVVRLSRRLRLLARLAEAIDQADLLRLVPENARCHLVAEQRMSRARTAALVWAAQRIGATLAQAPYPLVLLKGAAYLGTGAPIAAGRLPSDLDILVPKAHIADAQARLIDAGWSEADMDAHDQHYYREWSHELPPMTHPVHGIELDLHHNILPPLARTHVDAEALLTHLQACQWPHWQVLQPVDQVLHSASHLFLDAEPRDRLRDLVDLDGLMRCFSVDPAFWPALPQRARNLGLTEPLALAAHFCTRWLGTPIPVAVCHEIERQGPGAIRRSWLYPLMTAVLTPTEPDALPSIAQELAAQAVLARHHYQRLPMRLLLPHLWHKLRKPRANDLQSPADLA